MENSARLAFTIRLLTAGIGVLLFTSCATSSSQQAPWVRTVDFKAAPQNNGLADRVRLMGNTLYPQICALLAETNSKFPRHFDISLKKHLRSGNLAEARLTEVCLNGDYLDQFEREPACLDDVVVHEMTHVAQHYYRPIIGHWIVFDPRPPAHWMEGIADYVCFKLGQTNGWRCAECSAAYPHYRNGYSCAGAFLLFVEQNYNARVVSQLNTLLRRGRYTDAFFVKSTGKGLPTLWAEFQETAAFTGSAQRMLQLQLELGYSNGKPPKDVEQRFQRLLAQQTNARVRELMAGAQIAGLKKGDLQSRLALFQYFSQPGGTAEAFIVSLQESHHLPGFVKGEHGTLTGLLRHRDFNSSFPAVRTFTATKQGDKSTYHYTVGRSSLESSWQLQRSWRTSPDAVGVEEYPVP